MKLKAVFGLILFLISCSSTEVSPTLLPTSIRKTINRFNYCLNHIDYPKVFATLDQILVDSAKDEFDELTEIITDILLTHAKKSNKKIPTYNPQRSQGYQALGRKSGNGSEQNKNKSKTAPFKEQIKQFTLSAQSLRIKLTRISINHNKAKVLAIFYDRQFATEDKKVIYLQKIKKLWKISKIASSY